jgi:hypothetical protein
MTARSRRIRTYRKRGKGNGGGVARRWDEWPMDTDLEVIIRRVQGGGLFEEQFVVAVWIPSDCRSEID